MAWLTIREIPVTNEGDHVDPPAAPDLNATLAAIDDLAVHHCGHCDSALGPEAPSKYWCDDDCQTAWNEARSEALVGYREPDDLPQHVYNQVEDGSPETTPAGSFLDYAAAMLGMSRNGIWSRWLPIASPPDPPQVRGHRADLIAFDEIGDAFDVPRELLGRPFTWTMGDTPGGFAFTITVDNSAFERSMDNLRATTDRLLFGDLTNWHPTGLITSLKVETTVEPAPPTVGVEFDFDHPSTPALAAEEPPAPVMAPVELDVDAIQRVIDGSGPPRDRRNSQRRRIDPRRTQP